MLESLDTGQGSAGPLCPPSCHPSSKHAWSPARRVAPRAWGPRRRMHSHLGLTRENWHGVDQLASPPSWSPLPTGTTGWEFEYSNLILPVPCLTPSGFPQGAWPPVWLPRLLTAGPHHAQVPVHWERPLPTDRPGLWEAGELEPKGDCAEQGETGRRTPCGTPTAGSRAGASWPSQRRGVNQGQVTRRGNGQSPPLPRHLPWPSAYKSDEQVHEPLKLCSLRLVLTFGTETTGGGAPGGRELSVRSLSPPHGTGSLRVKEGMDQQETEGPGPGHQGAGSPPPSSSRKNSSLSLAE